KVYLNDPATGPRVVTDEEFDHAFTGVALTFVPSADFKVTGKRPALLPSLLRRLSGTKAPLLYVILAGLGLVLPGLVIPIFSKVFVDSVLVGGKHEWLPALLIGMAGTALLRAALTWLQRAYLLRLVMKLAVSMASGFMWHVLRLPVPFFFARSEGDLASRVQLNDQVAHMLSGELSDVALDLLLIGFYGVLMLYFDPLLTSIGVATAIAHVVLLRLAERMRTDLSQRVAQEGGKLAGVAAGGLTMIETLKATGAESAFFSQWAGHQAKVISAQQTLARREQLLNAAVSALSQINDALVLGVGALRVMDGHMSVGTLVAFQSLMSSFIRPIESLAQFGATLQTLRGSIERLDDVLGHERDSSIEEHSNGQAPSPRRLTGELELRDVTFGYLPFAPALVSELDAKLAPGQRIALVGGTGSGKSTIAKLVTGLYAPWSGEILFDGEPRPQLPRDALTSSIALVDQDISLFEGTVRENLTLWDDTVPEIDVVQAAKDACIHEDITKLQGGYDARVTEGGFNFSGGQRQRLEIARALVRQPAMLVLDEATSALDPDTERRVDENLRRRGCSCLIVAHRLSTIRDSDEIIVLDKGRVVQRGSHEQLLGQEGLYRELIAAG
ncbi:MAG TPA: NHLP family bacteriocin export ABC transporter peptidase/permease/ATPase subunit, partial [Polyangiales bacterium]|nr:NHLP family bacteriocin export ABC transporter peptidase/permease/ATPase subunit [Polyangiales bacterium]